MKSVNSFLPYVMPFVMACPKTVARRAVIDSAIEFCERSGIVRQTLDPVSVYANQPYIDLSAPGQQDVAMVLRAWYRGAEMQPAALAHVNAVQAWRQDVPGVTLRTGDPSEYFESAGRQLGLYPVPAADLASAITVRVSLRPKRAATQLDDVLYDNWVEAIAAGALLRLHGTPGQAYTDMAQASRRQSEFLAAAGRARGEAERGRTRGEVRVENRPLA